MGRFREREFKHIKDATELAKMCQDFRDNHMVVVLTTGAYDLLHLGHLMYLEESKRLGHILVVGVNSDFSIQRIKGPKRPIVPQEQRVEMVCGFGCVDYAMVYTEDEYISEIVRPDILVMSTTSENGPEERKDQVEIIKKYGGEIVVLPCLARTNSSSSMIKKIVEAYKNEKKYKGV